jgi:hypothetical protein
MPQKCRAVPHAAHDTLPAAEGNSTAPTAAVRVFSFIRLARADDIGLIVRSYSAPLYANVQDLQELRPYVFALVRG